MATFIIYPEKRWVSDDQIIMWARDGLANGDVDEEFAEGINAGSVIECTRALNDAGLITTGRPN